MEFKQKANYFLIPQSTHYVRSQLPLQGSLFCRFATFPHTVGNHPLQGSLLNPSVYSLRSQPATDGRESPLSLRDISPHRGESPFTREPIKSLSPLVDSRPAPFTREPFDISPHCGELPYLMQPESGCNVNSAVERDIYAKNPRFLPQFRNFGRLTNNQHIDYLF